MSGARPFPGGRLVVATHNPGKLVELRDLFRPFTTELVSAGELGLPEPEETEASFVGNAELKAKAAAIAAKTPALADDSGLSVDGLDGQPGIYSARWAGEAKDFGAAMARIRSELAAKGLTSSAAHFTCALSLAFPDGHCETFEGKIFGELVFPPRGRNGFGYDPIFVPEGQSMTCAELAPAIKNAISHRAAAFKKLAPRIAEVLGS